MFHWIMVISVVLLFFTGIQIGDPLLGALIGKEPTQQVGNLTSMSSIRKIHFITAFILIASLIFRIYGAIRYKGDRLLPRFHKKSYWTGLVHTLKHYLFVPVKEREYLRNPLARTAYFTLYIALFVIIVTGLAMFSQVNPDSALAHIFNPLNLKFSEYRIHFIHHAAAWYFIIFAIIHVYMAFRSDIYEQNGEISSMISGVKYLHEVPADAEDMDARNFEGLHEADETPAPSKKKTGVKSGASQTA